jgi:hypothetical protein
MPTPSLLIVPARFKSGKLYSQIPTSGAGDFTVTRATNATRVNASGLIESVASGIPRLDYFASGGTVGCPALLVEPAATNTLSGSVSIDTGWTITADTTVTSGIISPSGSTNATLFQATNTASRVRQTATLASGSTYTFSCFGKFGALSSGFSLNVFDENAASYGSGVCQAFNLNEGTLGASGTIGAGFTLQSVGMENYGSGWYRCRMTVLMNYTPTTPRVGFRVGTQISGRPLSVASGTVNAWGAQLETGSVATSYIPTTTATVTRNADVVSVSGAVSGSIGQLSGTIYCEFAFLGTPTARSGPIFLRQAASRGMGINFSPSDSPTGISFISRNDGGSTVLNIVSGALQLGTYYKIAIGYDAAGTAAGGSQASGVVAYVNGVQTAIGTLRVPDAAGLKEFRMYAASAGSGSDTEAFNGRIRSAALYTTRLSNDELAALTSL